MCAFEPADLLLQSVELREQSLQSLARRLGKLLLASSVTIAISCFSPSRPVAATSPSSARCARSALISCVRWRTRRSRARCSISAACCSARLDRHEPHRSAASPPRRSPPHRPHRSCRASRRPSRSSPASAARRARASLSSRAQWCAVAHASMPTRQGGSLSKNASTCERRSFLRDHHLAAASTPCTWNTFLARSIPIVLTCMWTAPSCDSSRRRSPYGTSMPGAGAVHLIKIARRLTNELRRDAFLPSARQGVSWLGEELHSGKTAVAASLTCWGANPGPRMARWSRLDAMAMKLRRIKPTPATSPIRSEPGFRAIGLDNKRALLNPVQIRNSLVPNAGGLKYRRVVSSLRAALSMRSAMASVTATLIAPMASKSGLAPRSPASRSRLSNLGMCAVGSTDGGGSPMSSASFMRSR